MGFATIAARAGGPAVAIAAATGLLALGVSNYLLFHTLVEVATVGVAWGIFFIAWNARRLKVATSASGSFFVSVGLAYLSVGVLDLLHALAYRGMGILDHGNANLATQLWLAARLVECSGLLIAFIALQRRLPSGPLVVSHAAALSLILIVIFTLDAFPAAFIEGEGLTSFKVAVEYLLVAGFTAGALLIELFRAVFDPRLRWLLLTFFILRIFSELAFTVYITVDDSANLVGHLLKLIGFFALYRITVALALAPPDDLRGFSGERLRLAFRGAPVVLFSQDRHLRFDWSCNLAGPDGDAVGLTDADILPTAEAARIMDLKRTVLETGIGLRRTVELTLGGRRRAFDLTLQPVRDGTAAADPAPIGVVGTAVDIGDVARARTDAERTTDTGAHFLSSVSHDLRQPLQAMRLYHHLLASRISDGQQSELAERLGESVEAVVAILNILFDVTALDSGGSSPRVEPCPMAGILNDIVADLMPLAAGKGIDLRCCATSAVVLSHPALLTRMVRHLVTNAVTRARQGRVLIGVRRRGHRLAIEVWETGTGMSAETVDAQCADLCEGDNPERDAVWGIGPGLSVVTRAGRLLGHPVGGRTWQGWGSVFTITVPVVAPSPGGHS